MPAPEPTQLPSIQGQGYQAPAPEPLTSQEAEAYVDSHSEEVVDCRIGRHAFPRPRRGVLVEFDDVDEDDNLVVHKECTSCGCAVSREVWDATYDRRTKQWRYERISKSLTYQKNKQGETYLLPPGSGRGRKTLFEEAVVTQAMAGQSPAAIRKQLRRGGHR
jgi:hypothetical protein